MQLRDYLPKTLFGRMLSIILIPMILVQVITVFISLLSEYMVHAIEEASASWGCTEVFIGQASSWEQTSS